LAAPKRAVARDGLRATVGGPGRGRRSAWCPGNGQNGQNGQKKSAARPRELGAPFFSRWASSGHTLPAATCAVVVFGAKPAVAAPRISWIRWPAAMGLLRWRCTHPDQPEDSRHATSSWWRH